jgi:DNA mismatch repair protein MutS2
VPFKPGDHVHVAIFGKGIIRDVRNSGRYAVEVKGRSMIVHESELTATHDRKRRPSDAVEPAVAVPESLTRRHASTTLDLHGRTVEEAVAALDSFLNDAILAGLNDVRVIHGRSGGRLKAAVHARLKMLSSVRGFRLDTSNSGVTIVCL